jgi:hypothetical protein
MMHLKLESVIQIVLTTKTHAALKLRHVLMAILRSLTIFA